MQRKNKEFFQVLLSSLHATQPIEHEKEYNAFLSQVIAIAKKYHVPESIPFVFSKELAFIEDIHPLTEKTSWGGVALKKVDVAKNFIQKLLIIKKHGILGFEIHEQKYEKLKIIEGECVVLYANHRKSQWEPGQVTVSLGIPGSRFEFAPGDEHGIIALTDCVIRETSTNHLDDLVYIFPSKQVITP